jgi:hypothetical protein
MHIKVILKHTICWLLWFSVSTLSSIINWNNIPQWSYLFNIFAVIVLFYVMYFLGSSYYKKISLAEGVNRSNKVNWSYFLFKWEISAMLFTIVAYIWGSWVMDNYFYAIGHVEDKYTDVLLYIDGRFARGSFYVAGGIAYGVVKMTLKRKNEIIAAQKALNVITMQENALMKNTYSRRVKEMRNMVKNALAEKEED